MRLRYINVPLKAKELAKIHRTPSSSSSHCAGQRFTPHNRTLEVRPGIFSKKLELDYDYDVNGMIITIRCVGVWLCGLLKLDRY